jgi:hypothetical protein
MIRYFQRRRAVASLFEQCRRERGAHLVGEFLANLPWRVTGGTEETWREALRAMAAPIPGRPDLYFGHVVASA